MDLEKAIEYLANIEKFLVEYGKKQAEQEAKIEQQGNINTEQENEIRGEIFKIVHRINNVAEGTDRLYKYFKQLNKQPLPESK